MIAVQYFAEIAAVYNDGVTLPPDAEGYFALCNDCAAVLRADTLRELEGLHASALPCPACGGESVCAGTCCVRREETP